MGVRGFVRNYAGQQPGPPRGRGGRREKGNGPSRRSRSGQQRQPSKRDGSARKRQPHRTKEDRLEREWREAEARERERQEALEEERRFREAALERRKEEAELRRAELENRRQDAHAVIASRQERRGRVQALWEANTGQATRRGRKEASNLRVDARKSMALVRRVANGRFTGDMSGLLSDIGSLKLVRHLSELVVAILDPSLRGKDVPGAVEVASALHQRYRAFTVDIGRQLLEALRARAVEAGIGRSRKGGPEVLQASWNRVMAALEVPERPGLDGDDGSSDDEAGGGGDSDSDEGDDDDALDDLFGGGSAAFGGSSGASKPKKSDSSRTRGEASGGKGGSSAGAAASTKRLKKQLPGGAAEKKKQQSSAKEAKQAASRVRTLLRLFYELLEAGVLGPPNLGAALLRPLLGEAGDEPPEGERRKAAEEKDARRREEEERAERLRQEQEAELAELARDMEEEEQASVEPDEASKGESENRSEAPREQKQEEVEEEEIESLLEPLPPIPPREPAYDVYVAPSSGVTRRVLHDLPIVVTALKHASGMLLGVQSRSTREYLSRMPMDVREQWPDERPILDDTRRERLLRAVDRYFDAVAARFREEQRSLRKAESKLEAIEFNRGSVPEATQARFEEQRAMFDSIASAVESLGDIIDRSVPDADEDETEDGVGDGVTATSGLLDGASGPVDEEGIRIFGDETMRTFYMSLPDLRASLPGILFEEPHKRKTAAKKAQEHDATASQKAAAEQPAPVESATPTARVSSNRGTLETALAQFTQLRVAGRSEDAPPPQPRPVAAAAGAGDSQDAAAKRSAPEPDRRSLPTVQVDWGEGGPGGAATEDGATKSQRDLKFDDVLEEIPNCRSTGAADNLAMSFVEKGLNSKLGRGRLLRALLYQPLSDLEGVPYWARIVAVLDESLPGTASALVQLITKRFRGNLARKPTHQLDLKLWLCRWAGELTKFGKCPPDTIFREFLGRALDDFRPHAWECLATLLETCGRYLLLSPRTHERMEGFLQRLQAKQRESNLKGYAAVLLASAVDACQMPTSVSSTRTKEPPAPPLLAFVQHLFTNVLRDDTVDTVLRCVRKLPWYGVRKHHEALSAGENVSKRAVGPLVEREVINGCLRAIRSHLPSAAWVASFLGGLKRFHEAPVLRVIDDVCASVWETLHDQSSRRRQQMVLEARFLGELYRHKLWDAKQVFRTLYFILNEGHRAPAEAAKNRMRAYLCGTLRRPRSTQGRDDNEGTEEEPHKPQSAVFPVSSSVQALLREVAQPGEDLATMWLASPPSEPTEGGWGYHPLIATPIDPPASVFRLRLVCSFLEGCGTTFRSGRVEGRFDDFLVYLQRYALAKSNVPLATEFMLADSLEHLRPKIHRFSSFDEAEEHALELEALEALRRTQEAREAGEGSWTQNSAMGTIAEEEEEEEAAAHEGAAVSGAPANAANDDAAEEEDEEDEDSEFSDEDDEFDEGMSRGTRSEGGSATGQRWADLEAEEADDQEAFLKQWEDAEARAMDEAMRSLARDDMESRARTQRSGLGMTPAMFLTGAVLGKSDQSKAATRSADSDDMVPFTFLSRRAGGRRGDKATVPRVLHVPRSSSLAQRNRAAEESRQREASALKAKTLALEERGQWEERMERAGASWGFRARKPPQARLFQPRRVQWKEEDEEEEEEEEDEDDEDEDEDDAEEEESTALGPAWD